MTGSRDRVSHRVLFPFYNEPLMVFLRVLLDFFSIVRPRGVCFFFLSFFVDFFALLGFPAVIDFSWLRKSLLPCYFLLRTSVCAIRESDQLSVKKNEGILPAGRSTAHPEPCLPDWCGSNPPVRASRISLIRRDDGVVDIQRRERERDRSNRNLRATLATDLRRTVARKSETRIGGGGRRDAGVGSAQLAAGAAHAPAAFLFFFFFLPFGGRHFDRHRFPFNTRIQTRQPLQRLQFAIGGDGSFSFCCCFLFDLIFLVKKNGRRFCSVRRRVLEIEGVPKKKRRKKKK